MPKRLFLLFVIVAVLSVRCAPVAPPPPHNLAEYERMRSDNPQAYPSRTIIMKNVQRVLDTEQTTEHRIASMQLVLHLGADDVTVMDHLSLVLSEPNSPYQLQYAVLSFLLEKDHPNLARYIVPALARADQDPRLREAILQWLMRHPSSVVLGQIVKLWSDEPSNTSIREPLFRNIAERVSGQTWDQALLDGINSTEHFPRGRSIEVLARRIPLHTLKRRIEQLDPDSEDMGALQSFIDNFDYLPTTRTEFAAVTTIFKSRLEIISDAARLNMQWNSDYGYHFNVRDFHLLSRLARDPLRMTLRRTQLILEISKAVIQRGHVSYSRLSRSPGEVHTDRFSLQVENLSIGDLWNLYLLDEMLRRPRVQMALKILSGHNRSDENSSQGGLVFYQYGHGEAVLYPPEDLAEASRLVLHGRDALARFGTRFEKVYNTDNTGPSPTQLHSAKIGNFYGLTLTSVDENTFCAHYYNPKGIVVSLGKFSFR